MRSIRSLNGQGNISYVDTHGFGIFGDQFAAIKNFWRCSLYRKWRDQLEKFFKLSKKLFGQNCNKQKMKGQK